MSENLAKVTKVNPMLPFHHPRQNMSFCAGIAKRTELGPTDFYKHMKECYKLSYVRLIKNGIIHKDGYVGLECGWIQPRQGCSSRVLAGARVWWKKLSQQVHTYEQQVQEDRSSHSSSISNGNSNSAWASADRLSAALEKAVPVYDKVFVINTFWDFNYHHTLHESLPRLIRFYHFLRRHKDIYLHIMAGEDYYNMSLPGHVLIAESAKKMRQRVFDLVRLAPERIITGPVIARTVFLPNDIECGSSFRHSLELKMLARLMLSRAQRVVHDGGCRYCPSVAASIPAAFPQERMKLTSKAAVLPERGATIVIQSRPCPFRYNLSEPSVFANNTRPHSHDWRCLTQIQMNRLVALTPTYFPMSRVVMAGETRHCNLSVPLSLGCDVAQYRQADVTIGLHGAAMTNVMFMRPGTLLVEIVGAYDGRMMPVCGIYGPLAGVFGVHHYIYYYDGVLRPDSLNIADVLRCVRDFYATLRLPK